MAEPEPDHDEEDNPYIDEALMDAYVTFSPSENARYLREHGISESAQQIPRNMPQTELFQELPSSNHIANSQQESPIHEDVIGIPIGDGVSDKPPLSYAELSSLKEGDILFILEDEEDNECAWSRVTFLGLEPDGFRVKTNVKTTDNIFEEMFYGTLCDDDMPVIYVETEDNNNNSIVYDNDNNKNYIIPSFHYKIGSEIFIYDDANNFTFYKIEAYHPNTTKATLSDKSGVISSLYLRNFKHEIATSQSKAIAIECKGDDKRTTTDNNRGHLIDIKSINSKWIWIERTNNMKLKWKQYKNTLFGCIAAASKHLYPISLDYRAINFLSGKGLGFHWLNIIEDISDEDGDMDVISEHMNIFLGDSQLDWTLNEIGKYSYWKFERHTMSEIINDSHSGIKRLMELEQEIVAQLNESICCITNDEYGHLALIVGYTLKQIPSSEVNTPTLYYFKVKTFMENNESVEYVVCDLYHQHIVITLYPPAKDRKYAFQHIFNPSMLYQITCDLCRNYSMASSLCSNIDLFGKIGLIKMQNELEKAKTIENVNGIFSKQIVFALMMLFDSRKTSIDFIDFIHHKIKNAFHSQCGSESEWKFAQNYDISSELKTIKISLKEETAAIRRQQIFTKYIESYDGKALTNIEWEPIHRAGVKGAITQIIALDDTIHDNLKIIKDKLANYLSTQIPTQKVTDSWL